MSRQARCDLAEEPMEKGERHPRGPSSCSHDRKHWEMGRERSKKRGSRAGSHCLRGHLSRVCLPNAHGPWGWPGILALTRGSST